MTESHGAGAAEDNRTAILLAAEEMFARSGIAAVSVREIQQAAGQRNKSAIQYHFGSKDGLLDEIHRHRMARINRAREALLDQLEREDRAEDLRALVDACTWPLVQEITDHRGGWFVQLVAQRLAGPYAFRIDSSHATIDRITEGIRRCTGHVPTPLAAQRIHAAMLMMFQTLADREREVREVGHALPVEVVAANLVDVMVALLDAPVGAVTRRALGEAE
ncbi:MAG: TetR/AcrR family transcriptional regulator [Acidimicrobiia bacterium]